jgi:TM2 domain-containing membrane protein YozV
MKSKSTAGILALLLGGIGIHKFYLNKAGMGILYVVFCWTFIPMIVSIFEGIYYLTMSDENFNIKYNFRETLLNQNLTYNQDKQNKQKEQDKQKELDFLRKKNLLLLEEGLINLKSHLDAGIITQDIYKVRKKQLELESTRDF